MLMDCSENQPLCLISVPVRFRKRSVSEGDFDRTSSMLMNVGALTKLGFQSKAPAPLTSRLTPSSANIFNKMPRVSPLMAAEAYSGLMFSGAGDPAGLGEGEGERFSGGALDDYSLPASNECKYNN